jgi:hypothetical protein
MPTASIADWQGPRTREYRTIRICALRQYYDGGPHHCTAQIPDGKAAIAGVNVRTHASRSYATSRRDAA